ncbi:hypothetical protein, variant 2 [Cryptococcus amylolentus CBS 6039]|uniref:Uncharacterized protein n=1 Tax=Cryptococcus amylolentus CBS 6039 TaxID=1295533 RepID=A0A1E3I4R3_9TREE|nr:hypothetical protein, variant 2 [Cryptococcus amylolentus CBS 6039]ODN83375.1 hypothetical protein, variant 2 [Cryptococcus amylolentus CBS 6039]
MHPLEIPWVLSPPIILHTLSIPAIGVACFHSLNVWRAVSVLSARDASPHRVSSSRPATETAYQKWRAQPLRAKGKTVLAFASVLAIWVLICFTVIHLFPKIKSQPMMDTIVSVGLILSCAPSIYVLIGVIKPLPMHVRYTCKSPNGPTYLLVSPMGDPEAGARQQILRAGLSLAAAIGIVILAAGGFTAHLPFLVAIMTCWSVVAKPHFPRMSIRANILQPLKLVVFVCVFNGGVRVIANHYAPSGDSQEVPPPDNTAISDWVLYLGLTISSIGPMIMPGIMVSIRETTITLVLILAVLIDCHDVPFRILPSYRRSRPSGTDIWRSPSPCPFRLPILLMPYHHHFPRLLVPQPCSHGYHIGAVRR